MPGSPSTCQTLFAWTRTASMTTPNEYASLAFSCAVVQRQAPDRLAEAPGGTPPAWLRPRGYWLGRLDFWSGTVCGWPSAASRPRASKHPSQRGRLVSQAVITYNGMPPPDHAHPFMRPYPFQPGFKVRVDGVLFLQVDVVITFEASINAVSDLVSHRLTEDEAFQALNNALLLHGLRYTQALVAELLATG